MKGAFDGLQAQQRPLLRLKDLQILDLAQQNFACLTSYVVGVKSVDRILSLYQQEIAGGLRTPVDLFIRDAVHAGKLRAACSNFRSSRASIWAEIAGSTLHEKNEKPSVMVLAVLRYSFFADRDLAIAKRFLDRATASTKDGADAHRQLIVQALDFVMSGRVQRILKHPPTDGRVISQRIRMIGSWMPTSHNRIERMSPSMRETRGR